MSNTQTSPPKHKGKKSTNRTHKKKSFPDLIASNYTLGRIQSTFNRHQSHTVMDTGVLRSNTVVAHSPAWQASESVALLTAVLVYCRSQTPPLDPRCFNTDHMKHVVAHIIWPINSIVRTAGDCVRRYIRMRSAWRTGPKRLHLDIINFIKKHRVFLDPYHLLYYTPSTQPVNATNVAPTFTSSSAPIASSSNAQSSSIRVRPTLVERSVAPPPAHQPLQETNRTTMDLTSMNILPNASGATSTITFNRAVPQVIHPTSTASSQSAASSSSSTTPLALRTRHPTSAVVPVREPIVMPVPPANLVPAAPSTRLTNVISSATPMRNANDDSLNVDYTWYDSENNKHVRSKSQNVSLHIKLYRDNIDDPTTIRLFQAITELEQRILVARRSESDAESKVRKSTDAALAVKSLLTTHAALNVPELLRTCDALVVEDQKAFVKAGLILERLYRQLDGLWVAVEKMLTNDCACESQLHRTLFLIGCGIDSSAPLVELADDLDLTHSSLPLAAPSAPIQDEATPSESLNEVQSELEPEPTPSNDVYPISADEVYVIMPTCRFVVISPAPVTSLVVPDLLKVQQEDTSNRSVMSVDETDESTHMDLTLDEPITKPLLTSVSSDAVGDEIVMNTAPVEDAAVAHSIDDMTLVTRESPKRLRDYDADADLDMQPPSPKHVPIAPTPLTHLTTIVRDGKYIVDVLYEPETKVECTYQFKLFAEKNGPEATLLVRTCKLASCHSRIRYDIKLTLEEFNELLYSSPIERKDVASTCGRGKAINGKYDKFDLVITTSALKRYGRRGYADKYGGGFYITRME